jgi:hypothetical protein
MTLLCPKVNILRKLSDAMRNSYDHYFPREKFQPTAPCLYEEVENNTGRSKMAMWVLLKVFSIKRRECLHK